MVRLVFILLVAAAIISSCKKDKPAALAYYEFPAEAIAYTLMPLNRYFIYQDSASLQQDSVLVTVALLQRKLFEPADTGDIGGYTIVIPGHYYDEYKLVMQVKNRSVTDNWLHAGTSVTQFHFSLNTSSPVPSECFMYPFAASGNSFPTRYVPSLMLNGILYRDVAIQYDPQRLCEFIWAKNIGIIQRRIWINGVYKTETLLRHGQG